MELFDITTCVRNRVAGFVIHMLKMKIMDIITKRAQIVPSVKKDVAWMRIVERLNVVGMKLIPAARGGKLTNAWTKIHHNLWHTPMRIWRDMDTLATKPKCLQQENH